MKRPIVLVALVVAALSVAGTASANDLKFTAERSPPTSIVGGRRRPARSG